MAIPNPSDRDEQLRAARRRLTLLEAEAHRMRAELSRLEAAGEDAAAEQLEAELREREGELDREQQATESTGGGPTDGEPEIPAPSGAETSPIGEPVAGNPKRRPATRTQKPITRQEKRPGSSPAPVKHDPADIKLDPKEAAPQPAGKGLRRGLPAWAVSLAVHAVMLMGLGLVSFATLVETPNLLLASSVDGDDEYFDELSEFDFDEVMPELEETPIDELMPEFDAVDFNEIELSEADAPWASEESLSVSPAAFDAMPTDVGSLMTGVEAASGAGEGGESADAGGGPRGGAKFFGARSKGGRFVFVVDNSGSMKEGRLETTLIEIERSVGKMSDNQFFHVAFYSDQVYPMFFPEPTDKLVPATRENKRKLSAWLGTVEMCVGGQLNDALELAAEMKPDTVFLLSDGAITSSRVRRIVDEEEWGFVINTLGMTVAKPEDAQTLLAIANAHNGLFFPVGINPIGAQMARQRPIPYHNSTSGPGPVWGTQVRKSR